MIDYQLLIECGAKELPIKCHFFDLFFSFFFFRFHLKRTTIIFFLQSNTFQSTNSLNSSCIPIWPTLCPDHDFFRFLTTKKRKKKKKRKEVKRKEPTPSFI